MTAEEKARVFDTIFPGFFEDPEIKSMPQGHTCDEMILDLQTFSPDALKIPVPRGITFGFCPETMHEKLKRAVHSVEPGWVKYYGSVKDVYCAFDGEEIVSFCILTDFGQVSIGNKILKVAGPGCVGTVPGYRRRGIGLRMVQNATAMFKERGYDLGYIHYTGVSGWYAKLGYTHFLSWGCRGIVG